MHGKQRTAHIVAGFTLSDGTHFSVLTTHIDWPFPIERQKAEFETVEARPMTSRPAARRGRFQLDAVVVRDEGVRSGDGLEARDPCAGDLSADDHRAAQAVAGRAVAPRAVPAARPGVRARHHVPELHRGGPTGSDHLPIVISFAVPKQLELHIEDDEPADAVLERLNEFCARRLMVRMDKVGIAAAASRKSMTKPSLKPCPSPSGLTLCPKIAVRRPSILPFSARSSS